MTDLSHACIMCQSLDSLNTNTTIKISEEEHYQVAICLKCEDNAAPKMVRAALVTALERISTVCKELSAYTGKEVSMKSICAPVPSPVRPSVPVETPAPATVEAVARNNAPASKSGAQILNKPISRDQRRSNGTPSPNATRQKVVTQLKDPMGKPISLPSGVVVLNNETPIQSDLRSPLNESSYKDGYRTCHGCNGDGGSSVNGETTLCPQCGGSGLL